jgi:glycosidase
MDEIIAYWQDLGVDGFRADMAHMVPPEFWRWLLGRSRERQPGVYWMAEAYDTDPARVPGGNAAVLEVTEGAVMPELLDSGFDAVYDDITYDALKQIYDGTATANDLDKVRPRLFFFDNALRYAENHDEVRLAAASQWGGAGMQVGRPVSALLFGLSRGPVMLYHGQEVGEPAAGAEGFGTDDARTTIYDYWSMPEFAKWVNGGTFDGGRLSDEQKSLRDFYRRLLAAVDQPAFRDGDFYPLNPDNLENPGYGRLDRGVSGHWLYSYLRYDAATGQRMLVVVNLNPRETLRDVRILFPRRAMRFLGWDTIAGSKTVPVMARDRLGDVPGEVAEITTTPAEMEQPGLRIKELQPMTAAYYELQSAQNTPPRVP